MFVNFQEFICLVLKRGMARPRVHHVQKAHLLQRPRGARPAQCLRLYSITTVSIRASVKAFGPFGEFVVKETENEMIYLDGGSGMAPHLSQLTNRSLIESAEREGYDVLITTDQNLR